MQDLKEQLLTSLKFNQDWQVFLKIKIIPKSSKNEFVEIMADWTLKLRIKAVPEKWKANLEIAKFLKKELKLSSVEIISGKTERTKLFRFKR